jgi:hypothetical protein
MVLAGTLTAGTVPATPLPTAAANSVPPAKLASFLIHGLSGWTAEAWFAQVTHHGDCISWRGARVSTSGWLTSREAGWRESATPAAPGTESIPSLGVCLSLFSSPAAPVNALLNYCFGLLEAEAIFACQAVGLDPGTGIVHNDAKGRQSMALDLVEPVRPEVESFVLDMVERRTFRKVEFVETPEGHVRLRAPLTHELAEQMPVWARSLASVAEHVAHVLGAAMLGRYVASTPLTRRSGRAAQAAVKARKAVAHDTASSRTARQRPVTPQASLPWNCPACGAPVTNSQHVRCDACIAADPSQSREIRGRRGRAIAARRRVATEWDAAHGDEPYDPDLFRRDILPGLTDVKLTDIMAVTGWSKSFASRVRAGRSVPHVSTWTALAELAGVER